MKLYKICYGFCLLWILCSLVGYAQNRCWNDKRIPKEWFLTAMGGYTFGYGEANTYRQRDRNDFVPPQRFNPYYVYNAKGFGITTGAGVYLNKSIGLLISCNYLFGHHYNVSADYTSDFAYGYSNWTKAYDNYKSSSKGKYYVRSWAVSPALLYRFQLPQFYLYTLIGASVAFIKEFEKTSSIEQIFYRGELVEEHNYFKNTQDWKKNVLIAGIYCGLGIALPVNSKLELLAQAMMKTQTMHGNYEIELFGSPYSLDGVELSMGIKYNLFGTNLNVK